MAYDELLAHRVRAALSHLPRVEEKRMFRGITFMVDGKMCISVSGDDLMCRIDPAVMQQALGRSGCRVVVMRGREYNGYVYVSREGFETESDFQYWIDLVLDFNARALPSKKRRQKTAAAQGQR